MTKWNVVIEVRVHDGWRQRSQTQRRRSRRKEDESKI